MLATGASTAGDIAASVAAAATVGLLIAAWIGGHIANQQLRVDYGRSAKTSSSRSADAACTRTSRSCSTATSSK